MRLEEESGDDHVEADWARILLLEHEVGREVESCAVEVRGSQRRNLFLIQVVLQVDRVAKGDVDFADRLF